MFLMEQSVTLHGKSNVRVAVVHALSKDAAFVRLRSKQTHAKQRCHVHDLDLMAQSLKGYVLLLSCSLCEGTQTQ